jgi:hypothetical protein
MEQASAAHEQDRLREVMTAASVPQGGLAEPSRAVIATTKIVACVTLVVGALQIVCVGVSWRSDNSCPVVLLLGSFAAVFYAILEIVHLRMVNRQVRRPTPQSLRTYYWPALIFAIGCAITGMFGALPGLGEKVAEALQVVTLGLTLLCFRLANQLRRATT